MSFLARNPRAPPKAYLDAANALSPAAKAIALDALRDLDLTLAEIPDQSLAGDWAQVVNDMRDDLSMPPAAVLARLEAVRKHVLDAGNARLFVVGSSATQKALEPAIAGLVGGLDDTKVAGAAASH